MHSGRGTPSLGEGRELSSGVDMLRQEDLWMPLREKFRMQLNLQPGVEWRELGWRWHFGNCRPTDSWKPWMEVKVLRECVWTSYGLAVH